ncbi:MAG: polysaccharide biosynthesis C-terminal domain-containing protein [Chloroflexi bacterium]|nr:polysaccharide biosynthesis C-terminal domain-containing protein [Chloroflexota bacterium]
MIGADPVAAGPGTDESTPSAKVGRRRLSHDVARYVPGLVVPIAFGTLSTIVFARVTSPEVLGAFLLATALATSIGTPCSQWLQQAVLRFYPQRMRDHRTQVFLLTTFGLAVVSGLVAATCIGVLLWCGFGGEEFRSWLIVPAAAITLFTVAGGAPEAALLATFQPARYSTFHSLTAVARFAFPLALMLVLEPLPALLWGTAAAIFLRWVLFAQGRPRATTNEAPPNRAEVIGIGRDAATFGLPLSASEVGSQVLQYSDRYAIAGFLGAAPLALYSTNYSIAEKLLILVQAPLIYAAHPPIMAAWERGDRSETLSLIGSALRWLVLLGMPLTAFTLVRGELVSGLLLGDTYAAGHVVLPLTAVSILVYAASQYGHKCFELARNTWVITFALAIAGVANVLAAIGLTLTVGYIGGALATVVGYTSYAALIYYLSRRSGIFAWRIPWRTLGWAVVGSAAASLAWLAIVPTRLQRLSDVPGLLVGGLLGLVVYVAIILWAGEARLRFWQPAAVSA